MGVNFRHYIVVGVKFDYDNFYKGISESERDKIKDEYYYKDNKPIVVISDGMSGEYVVVGCVLYRSNDGREEMADILMTELPKEIDADKIKLVKDFCKEKFKKEVEPKYIIFTHYS